MTLEQIAHIGSTVAALALSSSLVYAALQFRIHARAAREARLIAAASVFQNFSHLLASSADCARILRDGLKDLGKLDAVERWRFGSMMQMLIANSQLVLELESVGCQDYFHGQSMRHIMRMPGARQWWRRERAMFSSTTAAAVDEILSPAEAPSTDIDASASSEAVPSASTA